MLTYTAANRLVFNIKMYKGAQLYWNVSQLVHCFIILLHIAFLVQRMYVPVSGLLGLHTSYHSQTMQG